MRETRLSKAKKQQQLARNLAEEALEIAIANAPLDSETIKVLRLTCKSTKAAANDRVWKFTLSDSQEPEDVKRSGLLNNLNELDIRFDLLASEEDESQHSLKLARAVNLLKLAGDASSKSMFCLRLEISASAEDICSFGSIVGNYNWEVLDELYMWESLPDFLTSVLSGPGSFPALNEITCIDPSAADIEALIDSELLDDLSALSLSWDSDAYESNIALPMIAAMRNLLQKATNLESLELASSTFEFFDCEQLSSLTRLYLENTANPPQRARVDLAPALARPWPKLKSLFIRACLKGPDLVRIFEAQDTLPVLKELRIGEFSCNVAGLAELSCVRRPRLEGLYLLGRINGLDVFVSKLAQLLKEDTRALPSLRTFLVDHQVENTSTKEALSELLSCPCMASLETLFIYALDISDTGGILLQEIEKHCPKLKILNLHGNKWARSAVALLLELGLKGAWPDLQSLGISRRWRHDAQGVAEDDDEDLYMPTLDVEETLRRAWPGLQCV